MEEDDKPSSSPPRHRRPPRFKLDLSDLAPKVARAAKAAGLNRSEWLRQAVRAYLAAGRPADAAAIEALAAEVAALVKEVRPIGANLNQIAHHLNATERLAADALASNHAELQEQFRQAYDLLRKVQRELQQAR